MFKSSKDPVQLQLERLHDSSNKVYDPEKMPHISAHSVIRPEKASSTASAVKAAELERNYQKACKRARKQGREPPTRNMSYNYWGYPMDMPYYAPYMGYYPYAYGVYPTSVACANFTAGAAGNCCQGYADHHSNQTLTINITNLYLGRVEEQWQQVLVAVRDFPAQTSQASEADVGYVHT